MGPLDLVGGALCDHCAARQHPDRIAQPDDERHVVLHQQEGLALGVEVPDQVAHPLDQGRIDAAGWFVEQDQLRVEHQHLGQLDELLLPVGQGAGARVAVGGHADELQQFLGPCGLRTADGAQPELAHREVAQRRHHVLQHGHLAEQPGDLERPSDPAMRP